jgi:hypothetical protein
MRRTCVSLSAALDVHPRVPMRILRHSKITVTMDIYTEVQDQAAREALRPLGEQFDSYCNSVPARPRPASAADTVAVRPPDLAAHYAGRCAGTSTQIRQFGTHGPPLKRPSPGTHRRVGGAP